MENDLRQSNSSEKNEYRVEYIRNTKLNELDVKIIRYLLQTGYFTQQELAKQWRVCQKTISLINERKTWKHV